MLNTLQNHDQSTAIDSAQTRPVSRKIAQRIYQAFCDQSNNEGTCLRRRDCCPHAIQLKRKRQHQKENKRTDQLSIDQKVGKIRFFLLR